MKFSFIILLFYIISYENFSLAQSDEIKKIKEKLQNNTIHDTIRCNILNELAESDDDDWLKYNQMLNEFCLLKLSSSNKHKLSKKQIEFYRKYLASTYNNFGFQHVMEGKNSLALFYFFKAVKIQNEIKEFEGLATSYNNIGSIYENQGNILEALEFYHKSLNLKEKFDDQKGIAVTLNNIANIYERQGETEKALAYFKKSLKIEKKLNNKSGIATSLHNLGLFYYNRNNYTEALSYYESSLSILKELDYKSGIAYSINNIGNVYEKQNNFDKALLNYNESLKIREEINDKNGISISLNSLAVLYNRINNKEKAFLFADKSLKLAQELGSPVNVRNAAKVLSDIYKKQNNPTKALEMYELYNLMKDSLNNEETRKLSLKQQYKYEFEKRETILKANQDKKNLIHANQTKRQRIIISSVIAGIIIVIVFLGFVYNRYKITQKQKEIISQKEKETQKQKEIVEQKNKEILDSITYAKRIQSAILPQPKLIKKYFVDSFILYKPKDIVAGDFYWFEVIEDLIFFAAADCTGHGVPGAMVSVVCHNALNRSVREFNLKNPAEILNKTREIVVSEFEKSDENVKDGMDISLCVLNKNTKELNWAGAHNPLWIIKKDDDNLHKLIEFKADKQPIGKYEYAKGFNSHKIQLNKGDTIYIFTDGYQDQFGGPLDNNSDGKKFKTSKLKELFLTIQSQNLIEQKSIIDSSFENWKGNLDQVDDVCIVGVRI